MMFKVSPEKFFKMHVALIFLLLFANTLGIVLKAYFGHDYFDALISIFDFDIERNIPTFFSSIMLIVCSVLLFLVAISNKKIQSSYIPWLGLSFIFLILSFDEASEIHERLVDPLRELFGLSGVFYYGWVIPYGIAVIIFTAVYSKFLLDLPRNIMILFLVSGAIFVSGAIGFELLGGRHADLYGTHNFIYDVLTTCEEFLEMLGVAVFIYALLTYMVNEFDSLTIVIDKKL